MPQLDQAQAQQLFEAGGFLILPLERQGQEFGIDGNVWAIKSFAGVKFIPPGLHLFLYSSPSAVTDSPFGGGITIRKGFFRITKPKEVLVRKYDEEFEEILETDPSGLPVLPSSSSSKRRREDDDGNARISEVQETIVSQEYLKTLDPKLAPYPFEGSESWKSLTNLISETTLQQVLGTDAHGDARCDALMASASELREGASSAAATSSPQKMYWGKARDEAESTTREDTKIDVDMQASTTVPQADRVLNFPVFDLKRSWKTGATAEEITRDSRDKSWLLGRVISQGLSNDFKQLLAQIQLAFVLVTQLHNFSALDAYKRFVTLLCRSTRILTASRDEASPTLSLSSGDALALYVDFLTTVLLAQLHYLRTEFFEEDLPGLDLFMLDELSSLRMSLRAAHRHHSDCGNREGANKLTQAWQSVRELVLTKFGWRLGGLEAEDPTMRKGGKQVYNLLAQADEEDEYTEEGEDAPVVVET